MKLKVLGGAKEGAEINLKKEKFLIGRASECTLRAGSDAISRRHCLITRTEEGATIQDLGSRNGTLVNDNKIEGEVPLHHGDEIRVGPLHFRFEAVEIQSGKKAKVKNVADVVSRAASQAKAAAGSLSGFEDDISKWLLGGDVSIDKALNETTTIQLDETRAAGLRALRPLDQPLSSSGSSSGGEEPVEEELGPEAHQETKADPRKPGKLPPIPQKQTKDSREAAADILRQMARRK